MRTVAQIGLYLLAANGLRVVLGIEPLAYYWRRWRQRNGAAS